jgi:hypothetical protein
MMHAAKPNFLRHISHPPSTSRDKAPDYVAAIKALDPDFDLRENEPLLDAIEKQFTLTQAVTEYGGRTKIREVEVRHAAGRRGGFSFPPILPDQFRLCTQAFKAFTLESFIFTRRATVSLSDGALHVLQAIFEALQDGVVERITIDGRHKLRHESPNGVACEIFVVDSDAVGMMTDSTDEDDDTDDNDSSSGDDSSDDE